MDTLKKVMIVEDDPLLSIVEEKMVKRLGYEVVGKAKSGEETLDMIKEFNPEILLLDMQLAGSLNGIQTAEELKKCHKNIPVIFLSGDNSESVLKQAKDVNYVDFLLKPVSPKALSDSLTKASKYSSPLSQNAA
ncbi:response regulator [Gracilimonas sp.]|uniref:response regulator n=1 Tax=Gracilimonas sp. TaxID=1974203 RepID=UPI0028723A66|nr:response regulator [Gracilimonas sp.]